MSSLYQCAVTLWSASLVYHFGTPTWWPRKSQRRKRDFAFYDNWKGENSFNNGIF